MPWTQRDVDRFEARLLPDIQHYVSDLNQRNRYRRDKRLRALYDELMKIRITEPTFFNQHSLKPGDVIDAQVVDGVTIGPFRTEVQPGGLRRINQFVEMPEELPPQPTTQPAPQPPAQPATFAQATATVTKPAAPVVKGNPLAARIRAVTSRNAKFQDLAASMLGPIEQQMTEIETVGPAALKKAAETSLDQLNSLTDLADAFKEMGNGGPLQGS